MYVHLYEGPYDQGPDNPVYTPPDPLNPTAPVAINERSIQDVLFLENRDRKYSSTVYELRAIYNVTDADFDLRQFGLFLQNDTLFIEMHLNDCVALCGRRLMSGDVIELPHQRDDTRPDGQPAINKFYVVEDANRASDGYSATWFPHIWRIKVSPMPATQEYQDILDQNAINPLGFIQGKIGDLFSTIGNDLGVDQIVVDQAIAQVPARFFETQQFYYVPGTTGPNGRANPWIFAGDGVPPDGATLTGSGTTFPNPATQGMYYLRTDYSPPTLFMYNKNRWIIQEVDWRGSEWSVASRLLGAFINTNGASTTYADGTSGPNKQAISKALKPRADF